MQDFLNMGGYAFYVWSSFAFAVICLGYLFFSSINFHKRKLKEVSIWQTRNNKKS